MPIPVPGLDVVNATIAVPLWVAGAIAALFVVLGVVAIVRFGTNAAAGFMRISIVLIVAGLAWVYLDRLGTQDRAAERAALEARLAGLNAQANAPGSTLACLTGVASEALEAACEKAIFATPETVAAAVSFTSAQLTLLADATEHARADASRVSGIGALKRSLEADPFGFVGHVLAARDSCTNQQCDAFLLLSDASKIKANIKDQVYDGNVARYAAGWSARTAPRPVSDTPAPVASAAPAAAAAPGAPVPSKYSFPSAASIPPVSIMNAEPGAPAAPPPAPAPVQASASPTPAASAPPTPPRRPQQAGARTPRTANQQAPNRNQPLPLQARPAQPAQPAPPASPPPAAAAAAEGGDLPPPPPSIQ